MTDVLVLIDLQRVFAGPGSPWAAPGFASIRRSVDELIAQHTPHVVFTRFIAPEQPAGATQADHQRALDAMALYAPLITIC